MGASQCCVWPNASGSFSVVKCTSLPTVVAARAGHGVSMLLLDSETAFPHSKQLLLDLAFTQILAKSVLDGGSAAAAPLLTPSLREDEGTLEMGGGYVAPCECSM